MIFRFFATIHSFGSGAPGEIFSPTMALGAIIGVLFGFIIQDFLPNYDINLAPFIILAIAGLFAAIIRASLTGIVIVMEMTSSYVLTSLLILTYAATTFMAQTLGSSSLNATILQITLKIKKSI